MRKEDRDKLIRLISSPPPGSKIAAAKEFGADLTLLKVGRALVPVRIGYRWRQLPFPIPDSTSAGPSLLSLSERALSLGFGFTAAGGRATVDAAFEWGSRTAGGLRESFATTLVGLTVRP